ncbi:MAG TPA: RNA polymerase sigma factor SigJ, partial [Ochrobactrum intermedium]|nr:RNA polymerase sigma factor SigJ [Brucella intermedia]
CRQLASRARMHVRQEKPRFTLPEDRGRTIAEAFFQASRSGDLTALQGLLAEDAIMYSDGGGVRNAALNPIYGRAKIMRFYEGISRKADGVPPAIRQFAVFDGLPGHISMEADGLPQVAALEIADGQVHAIYLVRNPEKLRHLRIGDDMLGFNPAEPDFKRTRPAGDNS